MRFTQGALPRPDVAVVSRVISAQRLMTSEDNTTTTGSIGVTGGSMGTVPSGENCKLLHDGPDVHDDFTVEAFNFSMFPGYANTDVEATVTLIVSVSVHTHWSSEAPGKSNIKLQTNALDTPVPNTANALSVPYVILTVMNRPSEENIADNNIGGENVGDNVGDALGGFVSPGTVGLEVGVGVGVAVVGANVGSAVVGDAVGLALEGVAVGSADEGADEGAAVGDTVDGLEVGIAVGNDVGSTEGADVGAIDGNSVGDRVGLAVEG